MKRLLRHLVLATCISAAGATGASLALADTPQPPAPGHQAAQHREHRGHRGGQFFKHMSKELGLSDQQKSEAKGLFEKHREQNRGLVENMFQARRDLKHLVISGAQETAVRDQAAKLAAVQADLAVKRAQGAREFQALLTPDQVSKFKELRAKHEAKMEGKFRHAREKRCDQEF